MGEVALLHEILHAFDSQGQYTFNNLKLLGWAFGSPNSGFKFQYPDYPELYNVRVTDKFITQLKKELTPKFDDIGNLGVYFLSRQQIKQFGYPTVYSVTGGPFETFAELGAYIALDPEAQTYLPQETIKWYQDNILK